MLCDLSFYKTLFINFIYLFIYFWIQVLITVFSLESSHKMLKYNVGDPSTRRPRTFCWRTNLLYILWHFNFSLEWNQKTKNKTILRKQKQVDEQETVEPVLVNLVNYSHFLLVGASDLQIAETLKFEVQKYCFVFKRSACFDHWVWDIFLNIFITLLQLNFFVT